mgnify:CR=1 FL=1
MDVKKYFVEILERIAVLEVKLQNLDKHFTNHLHNHRSTKIINAIYFLLVVIMFCYLKWGK